MTVSVIGADGRRILRGVDAQYAKEFAARIHADTGEELELVDDDEDGLVASGIRQQPFAGVEPEEAADETPADETPADPAPDPPKRRRRTP